MKNYLKFPLPTTATWFRLPERVKALEDMLVSSYSREIITIPVPSFNQDINITISSIDTVVSFDGPLTDNFNLNLLPGSSILKGNRVYIMAKSDSGTIIISTGGNVNPVACGDLENSISILAYTTCTELVYDGVQFTGIDIC